MLELKHGHGLELGRRRDLEFEHGIELGRELEHGHRLEGAEVSKNIFGQCFGDVKLKIVQINPSDMLDSVQASVGVV